MRTRGWPIERRIKVSRNHLPENVDEKNCLSHAGIQSRDRVQLFAQPLIYHSFSRDHLGPRSPGQCLSTLGPLALQDMTIVNKRS